MNFDAFVDAPDDDPAATLLFVINAASGRHDAQTTRDVIETALGAAGRRGELLFARPDEPPALALLNAVPMPVRVGLINDRVFLVNASLGLYPELLQNRDACKTRFGRSRLAGTDLVLPGRCRIERWDYAARLDAFVCAAVTDVRPAGTAHER